MRRASTPNAPTYRLFVMHSQPLARDRGEETQLRGLFEREARVTHFVTREGWRNSLVTFACSADACKARDALNGSLFRGQPLRIQSTRTTTRVLVRGLPKAPPHDGEAWTSHLKVAFPRAVHVERDGFWGGGDDYAVLFKRLSDAEDAVAEQRVVQGHVLSYDFGNDRQARTQRNNVSNGLEALYSERRRTRSRSRSCSQSRGRSRARSRSPAPARSQSNSPRWVNLEDDDDDDDSDFARAFGDSPMKKRSKHEERQQQPRRSPWSPRPSPMQEQNSPPSPREQRQQQPRQQQPQPLSPPRPSSPPALAPQQCGVCAQLLGQLRDHVTANHSDGDEAVQKAVIRAWFETSYCTDAQGPGEIGVAVSRTTLLREVNALLEHMQWPKWKTQSSMYKDWFLRELLGLSDNDIRKGRGWTLHRRDGFAPGGRVDGARNRQQRFDDVTERLRSFMVPQHE